MKKKNKAFVLVIVTLLLLLAGCLITSCHSKNDFQYWTTIYGNDITKDTQNQ